MSTPSASPCARAGWMTPSAPTFPMTEPHPTKTNRAVPSSSARQGCTCCSYKRAALLDPLLSDSPAASPTSVTVNTSVLVSAPDILTRRWTTGGLVNAGVNLIYSWDDECYIQGSAFLQQCTILWLLAVNRVKLIKLLVWCYCRGHIDNTR